VSYIATQIMTKANTDELIDTSQSVSQALGTQALATRVQTTVLTQMDNLNFLPSTSSCLTLKSTPIVAVVSSS
jgi:hypothetical protein